MLVTPKRAAVPGISCINPLAPLYERARRLKPDSWRMTEMIKFGSTPLRAADCLTYSSYFGLPVVSATVSTLGAVTAPDLTMGCAATIVGVVEVAAFVVVPFTAEVFSAVPALASAAGLTVSLTRTSVGVRGVACASLIMSALLARRASWARAVSAINPNAQPSIRTAKNLMRDLASGLAHDTTNAGACVITASLVLTLNQVNNNYSSRRAVTRSLECVRHDVGAALVAARTPQA